MTDPREILARIRKQADAATPGPWSVHRSKRIGAYITRPDRFPVAREWAMAWEDADAEFIAASRTDVPRLVDALEKVLELHVPKDNGRVSMCCSCEQWAESSDDKACIEYPCPTVTAITQALATA